MAAASAVSDASATVGTGSDSDGAHSPPATATAVATASTMATTPTTTLTTTPTTTTTTAARWRAWLAPPIASATGALLVTQNGVNTNLRTQAVQLPLLAAFFSFCVGLGCVGTAVGVEAACMHACKASRPFKILGARWYAYTGGLLGPCYVVAAILLSKPLGFATFQLCSTLGQLSTSLLADRFGLLLLPKRRPTPLRVLCVALLAVGTGLTIDGINVDGEWWLVLLSIIAALAAGCIFPIQACVNGVMQQHAGTALRATLVSFSGGVLVLAILSGVSVAVAGGVSVGGGEPWMWLGGVCGSAVVAGMVVGLPAIGAAAYSAIFIAAQLLTAFVFDAVGAFGFDKKQLSARRIIGVCLSVGAASTYQLAPSIGGSARGHGRGWCGCGRSSGRGGKAGARALASHTVGAEATASRTGAVETTVTSLNTRTAAPSSTSQHDDDVV